ncbi:hypothetical protein HEK616_77630 (plasmid) [Streptomyces nigrescens]|uniref:DUF4328 domain-containing protein n=1 Tax=Streptomyces nigrescens TaxID=1920 RepID=A0ABN6RBM9_STRNI|nr:hypothetical protein HEK616_77630 [Streptomyces nigrescens]
MPTSASPADPERFRKVTGTASAAATLILLVLVGEVLGSTSDWRNYTVVHDYKAGAATIADLEAADSYGQLVSIPTLVVWISAGVVFLVWLWRARVNAELLGGAAAQRRSRGWVVGGWFTPVANLWVPYQVMSDIWRASAARRPVPNGLVMAWWAPLVVSTIIGRAVAKIYLSEEITEESLLSAAKLSTLSTVLDAVAGVLVVLLIRRITAWQTQRLVQHAG